MKYREWKQMQKNAGAFTTAAASLLGLGDVLKGSAVWLLAAAAGVGGTAGWVGAKLNAHDKQDIDTVQKEYENERLKADLGYVSAKARSEYEQLKNKQAPKAMRMFQ